MVRRVSQSAKSLCCYAVARADPNFHAGGKGCPARSRTDGGGAARPKKSPAECHDSGAGQDGQIAKEKAPVRQRNAAVPLSFLCANSNKPVETITGNESNPPRLD